MAQPKEVTLFGTKGKVAVNWKLKPVKGIDGVGICCYDAANKPVWQSSPLVKVTKLPDGSGQAVLTESGSVYFLLDKKSHTSMWQLGIQLSRPELYKRLQALGLV